MTERKGEKERKEGKRERKERTRTDKGAANLNGFGQVALAATTV